MYLGRVAGSVWCTAKSQGLGGQRLLIVQPLTPELEPTGKKLICADCTGAGSDELVYWTRGKEASFPFLPTEVPVDTTIVGIIDTLHIKRP
jgi:ethanolamine utilization protein EutN